MLKLSQSTLFKIIIGKTLIEAVIVIAVATVLYILTTNSSLRGFVDRADAQTVTGWAVDEKNAGRRVEVQLFIDDRFVAQRIAADFRPALHQAMGADDWHGFVFKTPQLSAGEHEARVYILYGGGSSARRTLQLIAQPLRFRVDAAPAQSTAANPTNWRGR